MIRAFAVIILLILAYSLAGQDDHLVDQPTAAEKQIIAQQDNNNQAALYLRGAK